MVVMKSSHMDRLCMEHLNDTNTYMRLAKDTSDSLRIKINKTLKEILTERNFPTELIQNLQTPTSARCQEFYALPKTHKEDLKIRPIVSACGGIFDRLGWLLQTILKPLLDHVPAHLKNTSDLIKRFDALDADSIIGMIPISLDVISLYTNIPVNEAIETTLEYVLKDKPGIHGLLNRDLWELLHLLLDNDVFSYNNIFFQQIRGLAMGNRLSGTLAIICMDKFERAHITTFLRLAI